MENVYLHRKIGNFSVCMVMFRNYPLFRESVEENRKKLPFLAEILCSAVEKLP